MVDLGNRPLGSYFLGLNRFQVCNVLMRGENLMFDYFSFVLYHSSAEKKGCLKCSEQGTLNYSHIIYNLFGCLNSFFISYLCC